MISRSSFETEYRALNQDTCEGVWLVYLLADFQIPHPMPIIIYCDNKVSIHIAANPVFHERTKHIEIDWHVIRDKLLAGTIHLTIVMTKEKVADTLTKYLHSGPFNTLQAKLGMIDIHSRLRGIVNGDRDDDNTANAHAIVTTMPKQK